MPGNLISEPSPTADSSMLRRLFLKPETLARATGEVAASFHEPAESPAVAETRVLRAGRRAMATLFEVLVPWGPELTEAAGDALDLIDELEAQLTVYRDDSEVSRLNAAAARRPVIVEERLFGLLERSAELTRATGGAFDVATGALIKAWGFYRRQGRVPSVAERADAMARTGMRHVILDRERLAVRFLRDGLEINLGGIGKGYALDQAAQRLRDGWGVRSGFLHGGTSSAVAVGTPPGQSRGWPVVLKHPWDESRQLGTLWLRDRALGTSAATYQYFEYNGRKLGHLLDPRTGWPAEAAAQVTVVAPSGAEADALSTAFFVLGPDAAREYCRTHPEVAAVVLPAGPDARPVAINLRPDEYRAFESGTGDSIPAEAGGDPAGAVGLPGT